jgi:NIPSNAP
MRLFLSSCFLPIVWLLTTISHQPVQPVSKPAKPLYELRIYTAHPGKLADLTNRFRQHTRLLFERHGMTNIGYWIPTDSTKNQLLYILSYPDRAARDASWKAFGADPDWKSVVMASEANGKLVAKVEEIFLNEWEFSPLIKPAVKTPVRAFELRTYIANPGKLPNLLTRFHDHTLALFSKHGMEHIGYWLTTDSTAAEPGTVPQQTLIYLLAHPSEAEGKRQFKAFADDPDWQRVRAASEAAGPINKSVVSVYLTPTDFSPLR